MKKVEVNKDLCIGCGTCVSLCGNVFELGEDNKSHVKKNADLTGNESCIKEAIDACPVQAISAE